MTTTITCPHCAKSIGIDVQAIPAATERDLFGDPIPSPSKPKMASETVRLPDRFEDFWDVWPRKTNKKKAKDVWKRRKLDARAEMIIGDVMERVEHHRPWQDGYIPHATTYLNGDRWEDEIEYDTPEESDADRELRELRERNQRLNG